MYSKYRATWTNTYRQEYCKLWCKDKLILSSDENELLVQSHLKKKEKKRKKNVKATLTAVCIDREREEKKTIEVAWCTGWCRELPRLRDSLTSVYIIINAFRSLSRRWALYRSCNAVCNTTTNIFLLYFSDCTRLAIVTLESGNTRFNNRVPETIFAILLLQSYKEKRRKTTLCCNKYDWDDSRHTGRKE